MLAESSIQRRSISSRRQAKPWRVDREQPKNITVQPPSLGRAGTSIATLSEVVCSGLGERGVLVSLGERVNVSRDVPYKPMIECAARRIGIIHDQSKALRFGRLARPAQWGREILSIARKAAWYLGAVGEAINC